MNILQDKIEGIIYEDAKWIDEHIAKLLTPWQRKLSKFALGRLFLRAFAGIEIHYLNENGERTIEIYKDGVKRFVKKTRFKGV